MSGAYTALFLITSAIWVLLWIGYRNNKINDENKEKDKIRIAKEKDERLRKLKSLYPKRKRE